MAHRLLSRYSLAATLGEKWVNREATQPGSRQLNRQGDAVQPPADLAYQGRVLGREREMGRGGQGALNKEADRFHLGQLLRRWQVIDIGQRQRRHPPYGLSGQTKWLAAAGQDQYLGATTE